MSENIFESSQQMGSSKQGERSLAETKKNESLGWEEYEKELKDQLYAAAERGEQSKIEDLCRKIVQFCKERKQQQEILSGEAGKKELELRRLICDKLNSRKKNNQEIYTRESPLVGELLRSVRALEERELSSVDAVDMAIEAYIEGGVSK